MEVQVNKMTPEALNWAAATAAGLEPIEGEASGFFYWDSVDPDGGESGTFWPTEIWAHLAVLMTKRPIDIKHFNNGVIGASIGDGPAAFAETFPVAVTKCFVIDKLGLVVDVPEELMQDKPVRGARL